MSQADPRGHRSFPQPAPASRLVEEQATHRGRRGSRSRGRRRGRKRRSPAVSCLSIVMFVLVLAAAGAYMFAREYISPPDYSGNGTGWVQVRIEKGAAVSSIAENLESADVVKSDRAFVQAAEQNPEATSIHPGHYRLHRKMEASLALEMLLAPGSKIQATVTIPEGKRLSEIFAIVAKETDISKKALKQAAEKPRDIGLPAYAKSVEGYLFPKTYVVRPDDNATKLLRRMADEFKQAAKRAGLKQHARRSDMSVHELVTIASLVQGEARLPRDFPKVAAVVYNRIEDRMPIEFTSTVNYALGQRKLGVTNEETKVDSPYNTYKHRGLPPGPINSPGARALTAALEPAKGDWLYFVTTNPEKGVTKFTADYQEFLEFKAEFKRNHQ